MVAVRVMARQYKMDNPCQSVLQRDDAYRMAMDAHERLAEARRAAGYDTATDAAAALGVHAPTYLHHENGTRGFSRVADRYARFYRVNLEWLMTGRGERKGRKAGVALVGKVGAGDVRPIAEAVADGPIDWIELPTENEIWALEIEGDSASPRYRPGDMLLVDRDPIDPDRMLGEYCVLDLADGRRCAKRLQKVRGIYMLASENASVPIEEAPLIIGCYRIRGVIER
jgi:phage repressor protein C with HTH and peptisase S24 domain